MPHRTPGGFGGTYLSIFGGSTGPWPRSYEELALRFLPRLDPLAQALILTFRGPMRRFPSTPAPWLPPSHRRGTTLASSRDGTPEHPDMRGDSHRSIAALKSTYRRISAAAPVTVGHVSKAAATGR